MPAFFTLLFNFFSKYIYHVLIIDHLPGQLIYDMLMTHLVPGSEPLQFIGRHECTAPNQYDLGVIWLILLIFQQ